LDRRTEQGEVADTHLTHVEHDTVEVEEHALPEQDVRAVVAEERGLHPDALPPAREQLSHDASPLLLLSCTRPDEGVAKAPSPVAAREKSRVHGFIQLPSQHLVAFASHRIPPKSFFNFGRNLRPMNGRFLCPPPGQPKPT